MRTLRWGALAALGLGLALPATALAGTGGARPLTSEVCGDVSARVGSFQVTSPVPPQCTHECFIVIGPVNIQEGAVGVDVAPCIEG